MPYRLVDCLLARLVPLRDLAAPASVRREQRTLRRRLEAAARRVAALAAPRRAELTRLGRRLSAVREEIGSLTARPECCAVCARRLPEARAELPGGFCCGSSAPPVESELELAVLLLGGHHPERAQVTRLHAGCLFRTPAGCTLDAASRPSRCVGYLCTDLKRELHRRGTLRAIVTLADELELGVVRVAAVLGA
jgi:hypothetical protein